ncbi:hypothetical protein [Streptococcus azizii]
MLICLLEQSSRLYVNQSKRMMLVKAKIAYLGIIRFYDDRVRFSSKLKQE